jgi:hypothetical protein
VGSGSRVAAGAGVGDAVGKPAVGEGTAIVVGGGAIVGSPDVTPPPSKTAVACGIAAGRCTAAERGAAAGVERPPQPASTIANITINHNKRLIPMVPIHPSIGD